VWSSCALWRLYLQRPCGADQTWQHVWQSISICFWEKWSL
jgi:hypothetical protein